MLCRGLSTGGSIGHPATRGYFWRDLLMADEYGVPVGTSPSLFAKRVGCVVGEGERKYLVEKFSFELCLCDLVDVPDCSYMWKYICSESL